MIPRAVCCWLVSAAFLCGQPALSPPVAGLIRDPDGALRPLFGVRGNFLLGRPLLEGAVSAAFSGRFGLVKTESEILLLDGAGEVIETRPAPPGLAQFAFDGGGNPSTMFLAATRDLFVWTRSGWRRVDLPALAGDEEVVAVGPHEGGTATLLIRRGEALWFQRISVPSGRVLHSGLLPGAHAPALLLAGGTVAHTVDGGIAIRRAKGDETVVPAPVQPERLELVGESWLVATRAGSARSLLVRLEEGSASCYELPEVAP